MKNINPLGLFDDQFIFEKLTKLGDPLEGLNTCSASLKTNFR